MLLNDEQFDISHGKFSHGRKVTYHQCKSTFDYTKIKGEFSISKEIGKDK